MTAARTVFLALLLCFSSAALADVAVPPLSGRVVDQTGTLSGGDIALLTQTLKDFEARKGSQIAVLIVPTTEGESIEQFSIRVAEAWKIGRKKVDDGALLVVARNDRHLRIEVGYGLEGALTDATAKRIIDEEITPKFKAGDFAGGISAGVNRMIRVIDGEKLPAPEPAHWQSPHLLEYMNPFNPFVLIGVFIVGGILRTTLGRLLGSVATGGFVGLLAWIFVGYIVVAVIAAIVAFIVALFGDFSTPAGGRGRGGGWSGSGGSYSGGSSSSSGSSDSGGFSGGGGSFGGGGASGSW
jgi:uncharacterized protein